MKESDPEAGEAGRVWRLGGLRLYPLDFAAMVGFLAYSSSVTATPICLVAISRELSLSLSQAGGLEAMRGILILLTLLASGFLAGRFGKEISIAAGSAILGVGMLVYSVAPGYGVLLMALALLGLGGGVVEALINPLVQELHPEDSGRYLNLINAFWSIGVLGTMLGTGEALSRDVSWRLILACLGVVSFVSGGLFLFLKRGVAQQTRVSLATVFADKRKILGLKRFWVFSALMFLGGASEGAFTYWSASLLQLQHGAEPRTAGVGVALFAAGMIVARLLFGWLVPQSRLWLLLFFSAAAGVVVSVAFPLLDSIWAANIGLFFAGVSVASFWPTLQAYAVDRMDCDATSAFILLSCGGIAGFASVSWSMGVLADRTDLRTSFWILPVHLVAMLGLLVWERRTRLASGVGR